MFRWFFNLFTLRSGKWPTVRKRFLAVHPACAVCGTKKNLEVHHVIPFNIDPSKELDEENLIVLCDDRCHLLFGHLMVFTSYNIHVREDAKAWAKKIENRP
jgi:5-methylcytosine-specific restriction protein A